MVISRTENITPLPEDVNNETRFVFILSQDGVNVNRILAVCIYDWLNL